MKNVILEMRQYAEEHNVPIIETDSINFIMKLIQLNHIESILEIGSAIGYSAILMASASENVKITTIERDEVRYKECLSNIKKYGFDKKIDVVFQDALEVNLSGVSYDLIFIDAAKAQNIKFFEKFNNFLSPKGIIITDNINFHGYVNSGKEIPTKGLKGIVTKIEEYIEYLNNNKEFTTKFYDIGDGLAISCKNTDDK